MKLVIAQPYLTLMGGAEKVILKIAQHYGAKIYTIEYNKRTTFPEFGDIDIEIIGKKVPLAESLPYRASQGLNYGYNFYNFKMPNADYDLINAHISPSEWIRHKNPKVLWYCHTPPREVYDLYSVRSKGRSYKEKIIYATFTRTYKFIMKGIINKIEAIATNSKNTQERIRNYFSRSSTVINPGVDVRDYRNIDYEKFFIYPSRIIPTKRQDYVIDAFAKFQRRTKSGMKLIIAGALSKDKEHIEYFRSLQAKGVKNLIFKINVGEKEMRNMIARSTAVLFAAVNEDFGMVPIEAMASEKPIISVNEGGPRETIINGKTGYLVNSTEEMARKMQFIAEHVDVAEELGRRGRRHVEENYSWEAFFEKFDRIARRVAKGAYIE
ncbi:MAG: glycosyltransferase family 4 protein [Candidatus Micrarchaeaceae archaeon]